MDRLDAVLGSAGWPTKVAVGARVVLNGFWLGLLTDDDLRALDERYYSREARYQDGGWNGQGLFEWEDRFATDHLPAAGRVAVLGAGGGREVLALRERGFDAVGFESHPELAVAGASFLASRGHPGALQPAPRDGFPAGIGPFDAVVVGWGAFSLVHGRAARRRLLDAVRGLLPSGGPALLSFFERPTVYREARWTWRIASVLRRVRRAPALELGDTLSPNLVHLFDRAEIEEDAAACGFEVAELVAVASIEFGLSYSAAVLRGVVTLGPSLPEPTELEVLANLLLGRDADRRELPPATGMGGRAALEAVVAASLARPPCLVSFSGGRDSSAILALAVHVARREGLDPPIAATMRFPAERASDETVWQELVLDHLGAAERVQLTLGDELDVLGDVATRELRRRGLCWPVNAHMHVPVIEAARGGSVLTGVGGDELFDTRASPFILVARRQLRPRPRDVARFALDVAPRPLRAAVWRRRVAPHYPWLTPAGRDRVDRALARDAVVAPHRWDAALRDWYRSRAFRGVRDTLAESGATVGVEVVNPFVATPVLAELAGMGGVTGFRSRGDAMALLFGDLLPPALLHRATKASFTASIAGPETRAFARGWTGAGADPAMVDVEAARREWLRDLPNVNSLLVLQAAWLADQANALTS